MTLSIRIVQPASQGDEATLIRNISWLETQSCTILYEPLTRARDPWGLPAAQRCAQLLSALRDPTSQVLLCSRGGYGTSDLLTHLPWQELQSLPPKWIVGYSDITALHLAIWHKLRWPSIHGPMPATGFWGANGYDDLAHLLDLLKGKTHQGRIPITPLQAPAAPTQGRLLGGCLSVLCNLLGTPFFPSLQGSLLFVEDTGERPGQLLRHWNQLLQSDVLQGCNGVILGSLHPLRDSDQDPLALKQEMAKRAIGLCPCWASAAFGHQSPNWSLVIGALAKVNPSSGYLNWEKPAALAPVPIGIS